ncbi:hypothetical protein NQ318_021092 [Aromia moschata]|uniref:RUN domain-containing protein n=1 Tax=Aromia moschata TaxID=1265417 RepID=A0AAV8XT46_9CUCU|nr:hypothetical protein NQ318_021092 [Aromia moschata]
MCTFFQSLKLMSAVIPSSVTIDRREEAEKLLKQLLECVQECQKRYGGKTELATEFDSCVAGLCITLEAVFLYGLRSKPAHTDRTTLKQVSDIVAQSLSIGNESPSFWPFIKQHLTKHEQERYVILKQIWTDTGRGRAWIRSALNERSLERYFHTLLSNTNLLNDHYESWAILRDDDKNSMLPNMAAGLGSILFAISIDKPELNSGISYRPETFKGKKEPIIEAPIPENKDKRDKKKRKVARQLISFDDDDSVLSASIPSSSSSSASDSNSIGEIGCLKDPSNSVNDSNYGVMEGKAENATVEERPKVVRKLSIENSGSREKFFPTVPETLTPVAETGVGELTPVSVEINKNFESPDISDDILEVPTDISAVLTVVESRNKEELQKREERINALLKENDSLKEQVKKYVSAIQMLRRDDEGLQKALDGLQIEEHPDYKVEAKIFERKLVQDSALVEDRRKRFQIYLRRVLAHWPELAHCNSRFLLEQHLAFFK